MNAEVFMAGIGVPALQKSMNWRTTSNFFSVIAIKQNIPYGATFVGMTSEPDIFPFFTWTIRMALG